MDWTGAESAVVLPRTVLYVRAPKPPDLLRLLDEEASVLAAAEDGLEDDLGDVIDEFGEENGDGEELNEPPADER